MQRHTKIVSSRVSYEFDALKSEGVVGSSLQPIVPSTPIAFTSKSFSKKLAIFQHFTKVVCRLLIERTEALSKLFQTILMVY